MINFDALKGHFMNEFASLRVVSEAVFLVAAFVCRAVYWWVVFWNEVWSPLDSALVRNFTMNAWEEGCKCKGWYKRSL